jgi:hypothetical protein
LRLIRSLVQEHEDPVGQLMYNENFAFLRW